MAELHDDFVDGPSPALSCAAPVSSAPPAVQKRCFRISTTVLSTLIVVLSTGIMAAIAVAILVVFSLDGAKQQAVQSARLSFAQSVDKVTNFFEIPMSAGESSQYMETPFPLPSPPTNITVWNESQWYVPWMERSLVYHSISKFQLQFVANIFGDGNYVGCQLATDNDTYVSCLFISQVGRDRSVPGNQAMVITHNYSKADGTLVGAGVSQSPYDPRTRPFFGDPPRARGAAIWSNVFLTAIQTIPVVGYFKPIFGPALGDYVALSLFDIGLPELDMAFKSMLMDQPAVAFLIDNNHRIVASSLQKDTFSQRRVTPDYVLTVADIANNCQRSDSQNIMAHDNWMICQSSVASYGFQPLTDLMRQRADLFTQRSCTVWPATATNPRPNATAIVDWCSPEEEMIDPGLPSTAGGGQDNVLSLYLDGERYYAIVSSLPTLAVNAEMTWRLVVLLNERSQTNSVISGLKIAIGASVGTLVGLAIVVILLVRSVLSPLRSVARKMASSAYLANHRGTGSSSTDSTASKGGRGLNTKHTNKNTPRVPQPQRGDSPQLDSPISTCSPSQSASCPPTEAILPAARVPSYLSEVATIQMAYWEMVDELQTLKSYIPEHIRAHILDMRRGAGRVPSTGSLEEEKGAGGGGGAILGRSSMKDRHQMTGLPYLVGHSSRRGSSGGVGGVARHSKFHTEEAEELTVPPTNPHTAVIGHETYSPSIDTGRGLTKERLDAMQEGLGPNKNLRTWEYSISAVCSSLNPLDGYDAVVLPSPLTPEDHMGPRNQAAMGEQTATVAMPRRGGGPLTLPAEHVPSVAGVSVEWQPALRFDPTPAEPPPIFFGDNVLVDRDVSVVIVNLVQFHRYVLSNHSPTIMKDHEAMLRLIHSTARKCGGVLENFLGDHFWISFNATTKCQYHSVAATCFALQISSTVNTAAILNANVGGGGGGNGSSRDSRASNFPSTVVDSSNPSRAAKDKPPIVFRVAPCGITCGVASGRAFVGPMGNETIRRHTIISNAMPEAAALERQAIRYPNCGFLVGCDTIPLIEGYFQYILMDATLMPGSGGKRRRIATVKAAMCAEGCNPDALRGISHLEQARNTRFNPYVHINASFNAFLEGRTLECNAALRLAEEQVRQSACAASRTGALNGPPASNLSPEERGMLGPTVTEEARIDISMMGELILGMVTSNPPTDGRTYRSPMGDMYQPVHDRVLYAPTSR